MNAIRLLVLTVVLTAFSLPVLACRGTSEYPGLASSIDQKLASSSLSSEKQAQVKANFLQGMAKHTEAHTNHNMSQMKDSLQTLDSTKAVLK